MHHHTYRSFLSAFLITALGWLGLAATSPAAEFEPVAAELFRIRDGLGNVRARLEAGQEVRVAYFGGSITAQAGWRPKTFAWLKQRFPQAKLSEINAAIGGTGSDLGVFRYHQDVLQHKPHLVFVEFAVNDGGADPEQIYRAMEGIVRQTWAADPTTDICYVYTIHRNMQEAYNAGVCPRSTSAHEHVADHYGIPSINVGLRINQLENEGKLIFTADPDDPPPEAEGKIIFAKDACHPLDAGHEIFRDVIAEALEKIAADSKPARHELKAPMRADNWQRARLVPITPDMLQGSWQKLPTDEGLGKRFGNRLPSIWHGTRPGDTIQLKFRGTMVGLYDLLGPDGGQLTWTIDGKAFGPRPRFDKYCTYHRLGSIRLAAALEDRLHTVSVKIHPEQPDRSSVLDQVGQQPNFDPRKYEGTNLWVGYVMMIGEPEH